MFNTIYKDVFNNLLWISICLKTRAILCLTLTWHMLSWYHTHNLFYISFWAWLCFFFTMAIFYGSIYLSKVLKLAFQKPNFMQWIRSFEQASSKVIRSPRGLHCPLSVKGYEYQYFWKHVHHQWLTLKLHMLSQYHTHKVI